MSARGLKTIGSVQRTAYNYYHTVQTVEVKSRRADDVTVPVWYRQGEENCGQEEFTFLFVGPSANRLLRSLAELSSWHFKQW